MPIRPPDFTPDPDRIRVGRIIDRLCTKLGVDPEDVVSIIINVHSIRVNLISRNQNGQIRRDEEGRVLERTRIFPADTSPGSGDA